MGPPVKPEGDGGEEGDGAWDGEGAQPPILATARDRARSSPLTREEGLTMRIPCPYCGARDAHEFAYLGDATVTRPDPAAPGALDAFTAYVYDRANPEGPHDEFWYHASGCRRWLKVTRNTRTHEILAVAFACAEETTP
jgi:sarcosine oxidase subunit delta